MGPSFIILLIMEKLTKASGFLIIHPEKYEYVSTYILEFMQEIFSVQYTINSNKC